MTTKNKTVDPITKVNKLCKNVLRLTVEDFAEVRRMAEEQSNYTHPLKNATAGRMHILGAHNLKVLNTLDALYCILKEFKMPPKPKKI